LSTFEGRDLHTKVFQALSFKSIFKDRSFFSGNIISLLVSHTKQLYLSKASEMKLSTKLHCPELTVIQDKLSMLVDHTIFKTFDHV